MSRCFPYSPLGREDPLIESIKLQKEGERAKKKETKEKRKDKRESKGNVIKHPENAQEKKHRHKKRKHKEINLLQQKDDWSTKAPSVTVEQLERSSLTEEHGMPIQNPESSEGSLDSKKRRKLAATVNHSTSGTVLRIKLPVLLQKNLDLSPLPRVEQGKAEPSGKNLGQPPLLRVEQLGMAEPNSRTPKHEEQERCASSEQACFSGRLIETTTPEKEERKRLHLFSRSEWGASCSKEMKQFSELIMKWDAPELQFDSTDTDDQDWLFGATRSDSSPCSSNKINKVEDHLTPLSSSLSSCPPRACYVPEFDMYQLPYVIPF